MAIVGHIVYTRENFLEVSEAELFLLEVENQLQIIFSNEIFLTLEELTHELTEVCFRRQILQQVLVLGLLSVQAQQALLEVLLRFFLVLLAIVGVHADEVECVTYQHGLDFLVERARAAKRGRDIDLKEPRLKL